MERSRRRSFLASTATHRLPKMEAMPMALSAAPYSSAERPSTVRTKKGKPTTAVPATKRLVRAANSSRRRMPGCSRHKKRVLAKKSPRTVAQSPMNLPGLLPSSWIRHSSTAVTKKQATAP